MMKRCARFLTASLIAIALTAVIPSAALAKASSPGSSSPIPPDRRSRATVLLSRTRPS